MDCEVYVQEKCNRVHTQRSRVLIHVPKLEVWNVEWVTPTARVPAWEFVEGIQTRGLGPEQTSQPSRGGVAGPSSWLSGRVCV